MVFTEPSLIVALGVGGAVCAGIVSATIAYEFLGMVDRSAREQRIRDRLDITRNTHRLASLEKLDSILLTIRRVVPPRMGNLLVEIKRRLDPRRRARERQFARQLPDGLDQIAQALGAGLSLPQAIDRAARYLPDPMGAELRAVHAHMSISHSFEQSFSLLCDRYECEELRLVRSGIAVQSRLGGNMKKMLQRSARYARQSQAQERSLNAQTAQSRLSLRIIVFAPFVLCVLLSFLMPSFVMNLLFTSMGRMMLVAALVLDAVGLAWARRIMRIEGRRA